MDIVLNIVMFTVGLLLILKGADWLTDGAASIARRFGISTLVIGLTIVACGTSAPEFVVSFVAALRGNTEMAVGNIVGSNIFNILAIIGATALVRPIKANKGNIRNDVPFCILTSAAIMFMASDGLVDGSDHDVISRSEGFVLLCMFLIFMRYTFAIAKDTNNDSTAGDETLPAEINVWKNILLILIGIAGLVIGGESMVRGASGIARFAGVSDAMIALTIVSIGTSAPELATSIVAARKGQTDMAMGNVVGSVVFNALFVLGMSAVACPLERGNVTQIDLIVLMTASLLFWIFCKYGKSYHEVTRTDGTILVLLMVAYYIWLIYSA